MRIRIEEKNNSGWRTWEWSLYGKDGKLLVKSHYNENTASEAEIAAWNLIKAVRLQGMEEDRLYEKNLIEVVTVPWSDFALEHSKTVEVKTDEDIPV